MRKKIMQGSKLISRANGLVKEHNVYPERLFCLHVTMLEFNHRNNKAIWQQVRSDLSFPKF
jgi:hypothetical protein